METADIKDIEYFRREWVIAFADLWWQLEQHLECWCVQREPEQSTFQLDTVKQILAEEMHGAANLKVCLEIDMHTGENWYEAK